MATPNHLNFSYPCVGEDDDSDHTPSSSPFVSQEQSQGTESLAKQESKKKKKKKKKKLDSSLFKQMWNEEYELLVLKGLVDYRMKSRDEPKIDWDGFYRFLGGCIVAKFSKEEVLSKIRKLKRKFLFHLERINKRKDPNFTTSSDSEAFGFSMMLWGQIEAEVSDTDVDMEMVKEHEEEEEQQPLDQNGAGKIMENKSGEAMMVDHEEVANAERFNGNGAAEIAENEVTAGEAQQSKSGEEMREEHEEVADVEVVVDKITDNRTSRKAQQSENGDEVLKECEEVTNAEAFLENGAGKITENKTAQKAQKRKNGEEMLKEHEEVTNAEPLNDNGAAKIMENGTTSGKESHEDDDELCAVRDAFNTMISQGLSDYQKKLQLKRLMNLGTGKRKELSDEWKALCVEERRLNIKKLRFSAKLAEAGFGS